MHSDAAPAAAAAAAAAPRPGGVPSPGGLSSDSGTGIRVEDCLKLLGGKSDEEKFAGLLLVTKAVRPDDMDVMRQVMHAVGMAFMCRLLASPGSPGDSSDSSSMYQQLALNLLVAFLAFDELAVEIQADTSFLKVAKFLVAILAAENNATCMGNALVCMASLAASPEGAKRLWAAGAVDRLLCWLQAESDPPAGDSEGESNRQKAWHVLDRLLADPAALPAATAGAVPALAGAVAEGQGIMPLEVLPRLVRVLTCMELTFAAELQKVGDGWHATARAGLQKLLQNRIGGEHRRNVLSAALFLSEHFGEAWAVPTPVEGARFADGTFVQLIVSICKLDLRLRLEEVLADTHFDAPHAHRRATHRAGQLALR